MRLNYRNLNTKECYLEFFRKYPRKKSRRQYLFGFCSIGGTEITDVNDQYFARNNVTHLFVDSDGFYCSSDCCDPCIATGIFYEEPVLDMDDKDVFQRVYEKLRECSEKSGYHTVNEGNEVNQARMSEYCDFRTKRRLVEGVKDGRVGEEMVLAGLIREVVFKSTKMMQTKSMREWIGYDISMHKLNNIDKLFAFHRMYVVTRGMFTCPARSFFVFVHNQDDIPLQTHPLPLSLRHISSSDQLFSFVSS